MNKLAVFRTFGNGVSFPFRELGTVVRVSWLPMLILGVTAFYYMKEYFAVMGPLLAKPGAMPEMPPGFWMIELAYIVVALGVPAIVGAALYRVILFDERPSSFVYFRFGKVEFFLMLAQIVLGLIIVFYVVLFFIAFGILAGIVSSVAPGATAPISGLVILAFVLFLVWFVIRFMLWPPTIVDTRSFAFMATTRVTAGNFWRLLGLIFLMIIGSLVLAMVMFAVLGAVLGPDALPKIEMPQPGASPEASLEAVNKMMQAMAELLQKHAIPLGITWYVLAIIFNAMGVGLLGYAYKSIKGGTADERVAEFA